MKVLIAGANGQVGKALLCSAPQSYLITALNHQDLDIVSPSAVDAIIRKVRPDLIINAAAYTAVDRAESEPEIAWAVNVQGPHNLSSAAYATGARLFHLSTDFVFDGAQSRPYTPSDPTNPLGVYGRTKREGELAVLSVLGRRALILRTAWVYASEGNNFVRTMLRLMKERGAVRVVADQIGTPTSAHSMARVLWKLAAAEATSGIHHWTDAGVASWYDFAVAIAEEAAPLNYVPSNVQVTPIATEEYHTPARRPRFSVLNSRETVAYTKEEPVHWRTNLRRVLGEMRIA